MEQYLELTPSDRADIVCRVFEQKVKDFVRFLKEVKTSGYISTGSLINYRIDEYISTEILDPVHDPKGYKVVTELMMHGPCGAANLSASCMQNGPCSKHFPKQYNEKTYFDSNGPNRILAKISNSKASTSAVGPTTQIDEIQNYVDGRFICPYEACWRIFGFLIHYQELAVQILNVHLEDMQRINFHERDRICSLKENMRLQRSGLTNEERKRSETFAKWLLDVGDGEIREPEEEED
ncbi:DNA helicase [Tanacetum coccineum]